MWPFIMRVEDFVSPFSVVTAVFIALLSIIYYFIKNRDILPGPTGFPILGLFPVLQDETCHIQLEKFGKTYGDLFSFNYLGKLIINLGSAKSIKELHVNNASCFEGRFPDFNMLTYTMKDGVTMTNGESWSTQRKYYVQAFKEYGLMAIRDNMAGPIYDSIALAVDDIKAHNGNAFNIVDIFTERCMESMRRVLFGEQVSREKILKMCKAYEVAVNAMTGVKLLYIGPLGKIVAYFSPTFREALAHHDVLKKLLSECLQNIKSTMDENHPTCVIEDYIADRNKRKRENDPTHVFLTDKALIESLTQFVGDGVFGVACYIGLFINAFIEHPEEQDKIYNEIMEMIGPNRLPCAEDRSKLTYTNAFMNEVVRTSNFFPLFPSLICTKETTVRGYRIPKGSITLLNIWAAHHDPETYEEPYKFDPNRFITAQGKKRAELPVQFGLGKRACSGEPFVSMQAFLFLTTIVKNFVVYKPKSKKIKSELFLMTGDLEICVRPREEN